MGEGQTRALRATDAAGARLDLRPQRAIRVIYPSKRRARAKTTRELASLDFGSATDRETAKDVGETWSGFTKK